MINTDWLAAFPLPTAQRAAAVVFDAWEELASRPRSHFNRSSREPHITKVVTDRARSLGRQRGMQGSWFAEPVTNSIDQETGKNLKETRSDIVYAWNTDHLTINLIFEFKILKPSRAIRLYVGEKGLMRFVTGQYSSGEAVALMVGILLHDRREARGRIERALAEPEADFRLLLGLDGSQTVDPSNLFPEHAEFDTVHERPAHLAPAHGAITVSHVLLEFAY